MLTYISILTWAHYLVITIQYFELIVILVKINCLYERKIDNQMHKIILSANFSHSKGEKKSEKKMVNFIFKLSFHRQTRKFQQANEQLKENEINSL